MNDEAAVAVTDCQTHRTITANPRCACAPRVKNKYTFSYLELVLSGQPKVTCLSKLG